ncbi:hypothetical protein BZA77DRAFT_358302 [Pyronema omphalodes]|nr:hypothetical protein BZA77DRAFT_358302 [Pyronema omphalodes]
MTSSNKRRVSPRRIPTLRRADAAIHPEAFGEIHPTNTYFSSTASDITTTSFTTDTSPDSEIAFSPRHSFSSDDSLSPELLLAPYRSFSSTDSFLSSENLSRSLLAKLEAFHKPHQPDLSSSVDKSFSSKISRDGRDGRDDREEDGDGDGEETEVEDNEYPEKRIDPGLKNITNGFSMMDINARNPGWAQTEDSFFSTTSVRKFFLWIFKTLWKIFVLVVVLSVVYTLMMWNWERINHSKKVLKPVPMDYWNRVMGFEEGEDWKQLEIGV